MTGVGTVVERPLERVWGWWLDVEGAPLVRVEVFAGTIRLSRKQSNSKSRDGTRIIRHCHIAHVRVCECKDPKLNAHMKGIRKYFSEAATVYIQDVS